MDHYHMSYVRQAQREDGQYITETCAVGLTAVILGLS